MIANTFRSILTPPSLREVLEAVVLWFRRLDTHLFAQACTQAGHPKIAREITKQPIKNCWRAKKFLDEQFPEADVRKIFNNYQILKKNKRHGKGPIPN